MLLLSQPKVEIPRLHERSRALHFLTIILTFPF